MPLEDGAEQVILPRARGVFGESLRRRCPVRIADHSRCVVFQTIHPVVPHAITELSAHNKHSKSVCGHFLACKS